MSSQEDRAKSIFLNALEIVSQEERSAYVDQECGGDAGLRSEVEELLRHHPKVGGFLERPGS